MSRFSLDLLDFFAAGEAAGDTLRSSTMPRDMFATWEDGGGAEVVPSSSKAVASSLFAGAHRDVAEATRDERLDFSPTKSLDSESADALTILLFEAGLDEYEEFLRSRGIATPALLYKLDEDEVYSLIAKTIHARKMVDLINGRKLKSVTVKITGGSLGSFKAKGSRAPTPDNKSSSGGGASKQAERTSQELVLEAGSPTGKLAAVWNKALNHDDGSSGAGSCGQGAARQRAVRAVVRTCKETAAAGEKLLPCDLLSFVGCPVNSSSSSHNGNHNKNSSNTEVLTVVERRIVLLAAARCLAVDDAAAYKRAFWAPAVDSPGCGEASLLFRHLARSAQATNNLKMLPDRMRTKRTLMSHQQRVIRKLLLPKKLSKKHLRFHNSLFWSTMSPRSSRKSVDHNQGRELGEGQPQTSSDKELNKASSFGSSVMSSVSSNRSSSSSVTGGSGRGRGGIISGGGGGDAVKVGQVRAAFNAASDAWDATTRMEYKAYTCMLTVSQAADVAAAFDAESLANDGNSSDALLGGAAATSEAVAVTTTAATAAAASAVAAVKWGWGDTVGAGAAEGVGSEDAANGNSGEESNSSGKDDVGWARTVLAEEFARVKDHLRRLMRGAEKLCAETTAVQNEVQLDMTRTFTTLGGGTLRALIGDDDALEVRRERRRW